MSREIQILAAGTRALTEPEGELIANIVAESQKGTDCEISSASLTFYDWGQRSDDPEHFEGHITVILIGDAPRSWSLACDWKAANTNSIKNLVKKALANTKLAGVEVQATWQVERSVPYQRAPHYAGRLGHDAFKHMN
jgi:hypothetical protein